MWGIMIREKPQKQRNSITSAIYQCTNELFDAVGFKTFK